MKWSLNPDEVNEGWSGSSSGGTFERKTKITSCCIQLVHQPTKIKVEGEVPVGNYSKNEMRQRTENMKEKLLIELEQKVAKHLRIPGRQ